MKKTLAALALALLILIPLHVHAANVSFNITANSGSANSANTGSFSQSAVTVNQGDSVTITFSVPSNDPYCCGIRVKGNGGQFDTGTISPGGSKSVSFTASSSFGFTSFWPTGTQGFVKAHGNVNVNTPTPSPPSAPTGVSASGISTSQIKVTWNVASGATSYKVQRNGSTVGTTSSTQYTDNGLNANTTYNYKVIASNAGGDSAASAQVSATTQAVQSTPSGGGSTSSSSPASGTTSNNTSGSTGTSPKTNNTTSTNNQLYVDDSRYYASIGDKSFSLDNLPAVAKDQKLEVYGTSVANAKVTVTSENNTLASVTAQSNGDWEATLDLSKLAIGSHDAKIDLSANGQTNSKTFKLVLADETTAVQSQQAMRTITPPQHSKPVSKIPLIVVSSVVGLVLAAGVTGLYLLRDKKPKLPITTPLAPVAPAAPPPPQQPQLQPHTLITPDAPTPPETPPQTS